MKKTGQLVFTSKKNQDIMLLIKEAEETSVLYLYYVEITTKEVCSFDVEGSIIETQPNETLTIRTPIKSFLSLTSGVKISILYETGDSTEFGYSGLQKIVGNGYLLTNNKNIIGAINELYSGMNTPSSPGLGTSGPVLPNYDTVLKITEEKFQEWNGYSEKIVELQNAASEINKEVQLLKSQGPSLDSSSIEKRIELVEAKLQSTMGATQQAYDLAQSLNSNVMSLSEQYTRLYVKEGILTLEMNKHIAIQNVTGESTQLQIQPLLRGKPYDTGFIISPKKNLSLTFPQGYTFYWSGPKVTTLETGKFYKYDMTFDGELLCAVSCTVYTP